MAAILKAAARILSKKGWSALTTNRVAEAAGVSIGTLYEYFPDKQSIIEALVDQHLSAAEETLARSAAELSPFNGQPPLPALVCLLIRGFVSLHEGDPQLHRALSSEVPLSPRARRRAARLLDDVSALVEAQLRGRRDLEIRHPEIVARLLVDTTDTLTHRWYVDRSGTPLPAEALVSELQHMLFHYIAAGLR